MDNLMLKLDQLVTHIFSKWDILSTALFVATITSFVYLVATSRDPDAHPMLLARQATASPIRQQGESAVFRSHSVPHGIPLNSGLSIKDPGDSKWSRGRDGDLRDIWRRYVTGAQDRDGKETGEIGKLFTILGSERVIEHDVVDITRQINLIGQQMRQNGGENVAIYLPNSIEFLAALFACAFYNLNAVLVPYNQPVEKIILQLQASKADIIVAAAGSFAFNEISTSYPALKQLVWVVDEGSRHMDWNEIPRGTGGAVNVLTWQEIVQDQDASMGTQLPPINKCTDFMKVVAFHADEPIEYTHANIIAGIAGQLTSIPTTQRIAPSDLVLPIDSLSTIYPLTLTLAALHSNASVALTSVAARSPDLVLASQGTAPTIIIASSGTLAALHKNTSSKLNSNLYKFVHWLQSRSLVNNGVMPAASYVSRMFDHLRPSIGTNPGRLRLIFASTVAGSEEPLSSTTLSDLRIYTGSRIIYALTAPNVAGAVAQTGLYDYRVSEDRGPKSHFGAPVTSVEIFFRDAEGLGTTDDVAKGELCVRGPAVAGGEANLRVRGEMNEDFTLSLK